MSYDPIDASQFCSFTVSDPEDDWISAVYIVNQKAEVLLDVSYASYSETGYRDATDNIIVCTPGDVLTISVTVEAGSSGWDQALSWGHTILSEDLEKVADLLLSDGCPWTHTFDWTVLEVPGTHMISFWEHYGNFDDGCGGFYYAERQDYTIVILPVVQTSYGTWDDKAPVYVWSIPATTPRQEVFIIMLKADGLDDFELPVSTISIRRRDVSASYISVTVPNPVQWTSEIIARTAGRMYIYAGYITGEDRHLQEIIYANIQSIYFTQGSRPILTIAGTRYITHSSPKTVSLPRASEIKKDEHGRYKVRSPLDWYITPNDTAILPDARQFTVDFVGITVAQGNAFMDVQGE